ncbi:hypothetical protein Tco_1200333 [Tanacetum coccineum]
MNELVNNGIKLLKLEINTGFINGLPKKGLSFCQSLKNINHVKEFELASLFGKLKYQENLIDSIYESEKKKSLVTTTPLSTAFFSTSIIQDFQDSLDDEEDTRSSQEYLNDLEEEYQERALLAKFKRFFKKGSQRFTSAKVTDDTICHKCGRKGLVAEAYEWDEEDMSSYDNEMTEVKVLMALADDKNVAVGKESAKNKKNLGLDQLAEDPSSSRQIDLVFVKSSAEDIKVSIPGVERPWLSEAEGFILPNHDTANESLVCSTPLPPLEKLDGAEPVSVPKTIKSILKSNSTFKVEALKGVTINEPSSAPAKAKALASKLT